MSKNLKDFAAMAASEATGAGAFWGPLSSDHEGYGVLMEEVEELWAEIKNKTPNRKNIRAEAIQVAAVALRIAMECGE